MTLSESRDVGELYRNSNNKELSVILADLYKDMTLGLVSEIQLTLPYVGLRHFRDNVLAPAITFRLTQLASGLILNELISRGELEVYQKEFPNAEYPVSAIRKPTPTTNSPIVGNNTISTTE